MTSGVVWATPTASFLLGVLVFGLSNVSIIKVRVRDLPKMFTRGCQRVDMPGLGGRLSSYFSTSGPNGGVISTPLPIKP